MDQYKQFNKMDTLIVPLTCSRNKQTSVLFFFFFFLKADIQLRKDKLSIFF